MAIATVCGRFLLGALAGLVIWGLSVRIYTRLIGIWRANAGPAWLLTGWCFLGLVMGCGLIGALLPTIRMLARAALSGLPFFRRYDWF